MDKSDARLDDDLVARFSASYFGYGNRNAPLWFVGMEEGGGISYEDVSKRLAAWRDRGEPAFDDLAGFHRAIGIEAPFQGDRPKLQSPTWTALIRIWLASRGRDGSCDEVRAVQRADWGCANGEICLAELMPLPSPGTGMWRYGDFSGLPHLRTRKDYLAAVRPNRTVQLQRLIAHSRPAWVVFYGRGYRDYWSEIAGAKFAETGLPGVTVARSDHTSWLSIPHPARPGENKQCRLAAIGRLIGDDGRDLSGEAV